jgi:hypothetical protein
MQRDSLRLVRQLGMRSIAKQVVSTSIEAAGVFMNRPFFASQDGGFAALTCLTQILAWASTLVPCLDLISGLMACT